MVAWLAELMVALKVEQKAENLAAEWAVLSAATKDSRMAVQTAVWRESVMVASRVKKKAGM